MCDQFMQFGSGAKVRELPMCREALLSGRRLCECMTCTELAELGLPTRCPARVVLAWFDPSLCLTGLNRGPSGGFEAPLQDILCVVGSTSHQCTRRFCRN